MSQCVMSEEIGASLGQCEPLDNSFQLDFGHLEEAGR
jgi:hypothetical protein